MNIDIFKPIGLCFGVKNTLDKIYEIENTYKDKEIILFGPVVHNEIILNDLVKDGFKIINTKNLLEEEKINILNSLNKNSLVIFQAHGTINKYKDILLNNNVLFFDLTCRVINDNKLLIEKALKNNKKVIFVGKKEHDETKSILDNFKNIYLYDIKEGFIKEKPNKNDDIEVFYQTSLSINTYNLIKEKLDNYYSLIHENCSLCPNILVRQKNIINSKNIYDLVLVIGSTTSSNTKELYNMFLMKFKNRDVKLINNLNDLKNIDFKKVNNVLLMSGTSASNKTIDEIINFLNHIKN